MKTIGLIGGMSWQSSAEYYQIINTEVNKRLGGTHSASIILYSFDFEYIERLQNQDDWEKLSQIMVDAAKILENAGADLIVICTNTMHRMADQVQNSITIPLLHIADSTALAIRTENINKIALLGTEFTMSGEFYRGRLVENHGLEVIIPNDEERKIIHSIIYKELVIGKISEVSKSKYVDIINRLASDGAEGVILGCTEIGLLIKQADTSLPVFDTTLLHAIAAVDFALDD